MNTEVKTVVLEKGGDIHVGQILWYYPNVERIESYGKIAPGVFGFGSCCHIYGNHEGHTKTYTNVVNEWNKIYYERTRKDYMYDYTYYMRPSSSVCLASYYFDGHYKMNINNDTDLFKQQYFRSCKCKRRALCGRHRGCGH